MGWHEVPEAQSLGEEEAVAVVIGERQIALCRSGGAMHAIDNVCTHQYALLSDGYVEDGCIECPLHQERFELTTGNAMCAPVTDPVKVYRVKAEGGKILVEVGE